MLHMLLRLRRLLLCSKTRLFWMADGIGSGCMITVVLVRSACSRALIDLLALDTARLRIGDVRCLAG